MKLDEIPNAVSGNKPESIDEVVRWLSSIEARVDFYNTTVDAAVLVIPGVYKGQTVYSSRDIPESGPLFAMIYAAQGLWDELKEFYVRETIPFIPHYQIRKTTPGTYS